MGSCCFLVARLSPLLDNRFVHRFHQITDLPVKSSHFRIVYRDSVVYNPINLIIVPICKFFRFSAPQFAFRKFTKVFIFIGSPHRFVIDLDHLTRFSHRFDHLSSHIQRRSDGSVDGCLPIWPVTPNDQPSFFVVL